MSYKICFTQEAAEDLSKLKKNEPAAFKKAEELLRELREHPRTGTGRPEQMKHGYKGCWSRRITQKHRMVYSVDDEKITVLVISAMGHYGDK